MTVLGAARRDPTGFLAGLDGPAILDEIQRAPELLLAIKASVDRDRRPGRFLLTGSASILNLPRIADALAGRMELLTLWPLSQGELLGLKEGFVDQVFSDRLPDVDTAHTKRGNVWSDRILVGGYPEVISRTKPDRRRAWFDSYINTLLIRDVRELSNITGLADMPRFLEILAARAGGLLNYADLSRDAGLNQVTFKRYFTLLQAIFLIRTLRPWFSNRTKRLMKSEKLYLCDTGLLAHLLDFSSEHIARDSKAKGALLENFVAVELMKQTAWSHTRPQLFHFRDYAGAEVDFVLESEAGRRIVGIEVKAAATITPEDGKGLCVLAESLGSRFVRGVILYTGTTVVPFAKNVHALPLETLWMTPNRKP
jgi:predicted AAA+ superfamily ATPase